MKFIHHILEQLDTFHPQLISEIPFDRGIYHVSTIEADTNFKSNTIYVGHASQVKEKLELINGCCFFLIDNLEGFSFSHRQFNRNTLIFFPFCTDLEKLYGKVQELLDEELVHKDDAADLLKAYLSEPTLEAVVESASKIVKNPLIVIDTSFNVLASSSTYATEDKQWMENIERGYCSYEYIAGFLNIGEVRNAPQNNDPFFCICYTSPLRRCVTKIYSGSTHLGYIIAIESHNSLESAGPELYKLISQLFARIIETDLRTTHVQAIDRILIDCLDNKIASHKDLYERLQQTHWSEQTTNQLLTIDITYYKIYDVEHEKLMNDIHELLPQSWTLFYQKYVIVLVDTACVNTDSIKSLLIEKSEYFKQNGLHVGISDPFDDLLSLPMYYQQSASALTIGLKLHPQYPIFEYDDYKLYDLILSSNNQELGKNYLHNHYKELEKYDQKHESFYLETTRAYIECDRHLDSVAERLHVHKNTVAYRIKKIKELFQINFDDPKQRYALYHSYQIADLIDHQLINKPLEELAVDNQMMEHVYSNSTN